MLAPLSTLRSRINSLRSTLSSNLKTAAQLRQEALDRESEEAPENLDSEDARERVEDVYEPLMGEHRAHEPHSCGHEGQEACEYGSHTHRVDEEGGQERKVHQLEVYVSYSIFFVLGACVLLPWNTEIVAGSYIRARLEGSKMEASFSSWVALTFTTGNLIFLWMANRTQQGASLAKRILGSIILIAAVLTMFVISTRFDSIPSTLFFVSLMTSTILLAAASSYLQNATVALSSRFGPMYLQGILSGQGAVGLAVATLQFVSALSTTPTREVGSDFSAELPTDMKAIRNSAFSFFLTIGIFSIFSLFCHLLLIRLPLYRLVIQAASNHTTPKNSSTNLSSAPSRTPPVASLAQVERKVRHLGIAIFFIFFVTLSIFPSITSTVLSTHEGQPGGGILGERLSDRKLWVPLGFIIFSGGDWIGRALPQWSFARIENWKWLAGLSAGRVVFVPMFLLCNVQTGSSAAATGLFASDTIFLLLMLTFSITNGYLSTLIMLRAIIDPSLEDHEVDIAATCLAFYLTSGLAAGSLISFPVRAAICHCNPFL